MIETIYIVLKASWDYEHECVGVWTPVKAFSTQNAGLAHVDYLNEQSGVWARLVAVPLDDYTII